MPSESGGQRDSDEAFEKLLRVVAAGPDEHMRRFQSAPRPGQEIAGAYRLESVLGRGGMGVVFRATRLAGGEQVALKWMLPSSDNPDEWVRRFSREARAASLIDHPGVVRVFEAGSVGDSPFLVMELLAGRPLHEHIPEDGMPAPRALSWFAQVLQAVDAAHAVGVIHRDLKPPNILVSDADDPAQARLKVLDFGVAKLTADQMVASMSLTTDGSVLGTPCYCAPEQLQNPKGCDRRADIYALGVVLYEMLVGHPPFRDKSLGRLLLAVTSDPPPQPDPERVSGPLWEVLRTALAKAPDERFANAKAFSDALSGVAPDTR